MERWRLRLFLDAGAGVCLWSQDEATKERFGYAVDHRELGLAPEVVEAIDRLIADYDASIDWNDPAASDPDGFGPTLSGYEAGAPFRERTRDLAGRLAQLLGPEFALDCDF